MFTILKQLQLIACMLKGGAGSGNFGHAGIPGQVGGSSAGGGNGGNSEGDKTPTGTTTRTLERIRGNAEKAFPGADIIPTSSGAGITVRNEPLSFVENGLKALGLKRTSSGRYETGKDSAGVNVHATVNSDGNYHTIALERSGTFVIEARN